MPASPALRLAGLSGLFALALGAAYAPEAPAAPAAPLAPAEAMPDSTWQWPERSQNLQILPDTTSAATLRRTMQGFTRALGVRCGSCHVGSGPDFSTWDFASDAKRHKRVTRGMMVMTQDLNARGMPAALLYGYTPDPDDAPPPAPVVAPEPAAPAAPERSEVHVHSDGTRHVHRSRGNAAVTAPPAPTPVPPPAAAPASDEVIEFVSCWTCHRGQHEPESMPTD